MRIKLRRNIYTTLVVVLMTCSLQAQEYWGNAYGKKPLLKVNIKKSGPYIGLQRGKYFVGEVGVERQWKRIKFSNAVTHAAHFGVNYNLYKHMMGYDIGYWLKPHRMGLTYGANVFLRTDFNRAKVGVMPVLGFKFWILHAQTGYHFMPRPEEFETNTFFISLRIGIINERDVDLKRRKKG